MNPERKHVLVWVAQEFLESAGMLRILEETGLVEPDASEAEVTASVQVAGGCAITGFLTEVHHGAGVWVAPEKSPGLELMIPWNFVRGIVTAELPQSKQFFGLAAHLASLLPPAAS